MSILFFNLNFSIFSSLRLSFSDVFIALHNQLHGSGSGFKWNELKNKASRTASHKAHNNEWEENKAHCSTQCSHVSSRFMHICSPFGSGDNLCTFSGARWLTSSALVKSKRKLDNKMKYNSSGIAIAETICNVHGTDYMHRSIGSFNLPSRTSNAINFWCKHFIAEAHSIQTHDTHIHPIRVTVTPECIDTSGERKITNIRDMCELWNAIWNVDDLYLCVYPSPNRQIWWKTKRLMTLIKSMSKQKSMDVCTSDVLCVHR